MIDCQKYRIIFNVLKVIAPKLLTPRHSWVSYQVEDKQVMQPELQDENDLNNAFHTITF